MTGEQLETEIFMGPTYYMRLKHMVKDKINHRPTGRVNQLTKQPVAGRANDGGLRIGEMERDGVISHGATEFLRESMMERADKYYMAICNTTGMIAVYNPDKNLFMSPLVDGPIQFSGTVNEQESNIQNITKFGRSFSIVCVPYSFKLLMQELQSINVHMRIITEDNIDQIENLSFSKNIQKLTHTEHLDTKETIDQVQRDIRVLLRESNNDKFVIEDVEATPVFQPQTPDMPPPSESPELLPHTPDMSPPEDASPQYMVGTPEFQPMTPETTPFVSPQMMKRGQFMDTPSDDESSPPLPPSQPETSPSYHPITPEKTYKGGDRVSYVKDSTPGRPWIVTPLTKPNLYKIESEGANQEVEIVTPFDIKPYETHIPLPGYGLQQEGQQMQQIPSIHIAPVFNMPGNTTSSEQPSISTTNHSETIKIPTTDVVSNEQSSENSRVEDSPAKIDFNNFIIKKV
jgi:hypothetical protein